MAKDRFDIKERHTVSLMTETIVTKDGYKK
jgi:hypothetical protein